MLQHAFISPKHRPGARLFLFTFLLAFVVILLGAFTRLTDAGLSCPDWPHCYGYVTAPHTESQIRDAMQQFPTAAPVDIKKAWTEMTHRYFAGTEGILILLLTGGILFARKRRDLKSTGIAFLLIALLGVQVMLGMLTVTEKLRPVIVLSHLLTGLSILGVLWWAYLDIHFRSHTLYQRRTPRRLFPWMWAGLVVVAMQITLGGWVSTHYAGLACVDFPYCNGKILPAMQWNNLNGDLITIHMLHRIGALVTAVYLFIYAHLLMRQPQFKRTAIIILCLITAQITLGILNIVWLRPVHVAMTHQAVGILLLLTMITTLVKASFVMENKYAFRLS